MVLVADLQSWGQCSQCEMNLWIEQSPNAQRCVCGCGACALEGENRIGSSWAEVSEEDFQSIVDMDITSGLAP